MPAIAREDDVAGGAITATASKTKANGKLVARLGDPVEPHGTGPHLAATMNEASSTVRVEGVFVCRKDDAATCGDTVAVGSPTVNAG